MSLVALDCKDVSEATADAFGGVVMNGDEYVRCARCSFGGCDVRVQGCGCTLHGRCIPLSQNGSIIACPICNRYTTSLVLFPMNFREVDEARKTAAALARSNKRNRKRKNSEDAVGMDSEKPKDPGDCRTGRWTPEEMAYVDELISLFDKGELPMADGVKLNDFLSGMLKSKQSRLTKKMKNAKLSSKTYKRSAGYVTDTNQARKFSDLEDAFYHSIQCHQEKAEIKFHMQKEWRELFSNFCVCVGQTLDADQWLTSVDELDRRRSMAREAAKLARRKLMMGNALRQDAKNPDRGVFIEKTTSEMLNQSDSDRIASMAAAHGMSSETQEFLNLLSDKSIFNESLPGGLGVSDSSASRVAPTSTSVVTSPFLAKAVNYLQRHNIPFEHVDAWVPSFLPVSGSDGNSNSSTPSCRLCYAGSVTADVEVVGPVGSAGQPISPERRFNLDAFGNYSEKFSFDVGCGLPGRVYQTGIPSWEQSVHNAPLNHFERRGGANQWGIRTVVGIPVPSPNVGRIVITLYSCFDRDKDQELVGRMCTEFTRLMPSPKWKLVVDLGEPKPAMLGSGNAGADLTHSSSVMKSQEHSSNSNSEKKSLEVERDSRIDEVVSILGEHMPSDTNSPMGSYIPGFMSLRLLLLRPTWNDEDSDLVRTMLGSYSSYLLTGRTRSDIALLLARDCMFLQSQSSPNNPTNNSSNSNNNSLNTSNHGHNNNNSATSTPKLPSLDPQSFFGFGSNVNDSSNNSCGSPQHLISKGVKMPQATTNVHDSISIVSN